MDITWKTERIEISADNSFWNGLLGKTVTKIRDLVADNLDDSTPPRAINMIAEAVVSMTASRGDKTTLVINRNNATIRRWK